MQAVSPELAQLKSRMKASWMAGDFGQIASYSAKGSEDFVAHIEIKPGSHVLDVACGTGNSAIPAARAGAVVTGVDIATNLLEQARKRAAAEGVNISFEEGDAEELPYPDQSFDFVTTMFGAMFAPRPERVASELVRVCRPGGLVAMANWTAEGFVGKSFRVTAEMVPPPSANSRPGALGKRAGRAAALLQRSFPANPDPAESGVPLSVWSARSGGVLPAILRAHPGTRFHVWTSRPNQSWHLG